MVLDSLKNGEQYAALHPSFAKAIKFVTENAETIPVGKYFIDGQDLYVMIVEADLKPFNLAKPEAHRKYIDIQIVLDGVESYGWAQLDNCLTISEDYDDQKDIIFFKDAPTAVITLHAGQLAIFFPNDVHAPLIGSGKVRKAIVKVKVEEPGASRRSNKTLQIELTPEQQHRFDELRRWRSAVAEVDNCSLYQIAGDKDLKNAAIANPKTTDELSQVSGFKEYRVGRFGKDIVALLNSL